MPTRGLSAPKNCGSAKKSGVGASTIKRMETFDGIPHSRIDNLQAIKDTFIATGKIKFEKDTCICVDEK